MVTPISPTSCEAADRAINRLASRKDAWVQVAIPERLEYLQQCMEGVMQVAEAWAIAACTHKGIDPATALAGEEWMTGPLATLLNLRLLKQTLEAGGQPQPVKLSTRPNGQQVAQVFPDNVQDQLMWLGFWAEVWMEPGQPARQGMVYRQPARQGKVALVLGAGNISAISAMDTLYKLFAEDQVVLLKTNPVNESVGRFVEQAFQPLVTNGFLEVVYGGAELGQYLCQHPAIDTIHITGSQHTHDAIAWGSTPAAQAIAKTNQTPALDKPLTSELGCVTPVLVVPGEWSVEDLKFQARNVASMVVHNASFNCVAAKVLVLAKGWKQRQDFLHYLHQELAHTPSRKAYYPGAQQRYQAFLDRYPQAQPLGQRTETVVPWTVIPDVPATAGEYALSTEAFCGVLAEVNLDVTGAAEFLAQAVPFVNDSVWGNLSCVMLIDPTTQQRYKAEMEAAIAELRYGAIGINAWTGMVFLLASTTWGAFPGNPLDNIQSGRGVVHNTYLFDRPQKTVLRAPFRIWPTPIWFADHKTLRQVSQRYLSLLHRPSWSQFVSVVLAALQG
jgi:acyl-CoA reductase-like NAD-dependent aldehyde dehydrogenase